MYIERDTTYDLLYVGFRDTSQKGEVAKTEELMPGTYFDFDSDGNLVGIEIVNTERVLGVAAKDLRLSGELLGVKEAAELAGKDRANFLRDLASSPDFPEPVARVASGQLWLSRDVERYLSVHSSGSSSGSDLPSGSDRVQGEVGKERPTSIPYRGWEHREGERYKDYRYEDHEQYEDHEVLDTPGSADEQGSLPHDDEDHEVHGADRNSQEEQESA